MELTGALKALFLYFSRRMRHKCTPPWLWLALVVDWRALIHYDSVVDDDRLQRELPTNTRLPEAGSSLFLLLTSSSAGSDHRYIWRTGDCFKTMSKDVSTRFACSHLAPTLVGLEAVGAAAAAARSSTPLWADLHHWSGQSRHFLAAGPRVLLL